MMLSSMLLGFGGAWPFAKAVPSCRLDDKETTNVLPLLRENHGRCMASAIISEIHVHPSSRRIITKRTIARRVVSRMSDPITVTTYSQVPTCGAGLRRSTKLLVDSNSWKMAYWHQWRGTRRPMPWLHGCLRNAKKGHQPLPAA